METFTAVALGIILHIVFPVLTVALALYLIYIRRHREQILSKDRPGTPSYEVHAKLLDNHLLALAVLLAANAIIGAMGDILRGSLHSRYPTAVAGFIVLLTSPIMLFILYDWRSQSRKAKN